MTDHTVDPPAAEREPDNVTPGWTTTPAGYAVPADLDDDPRLWTGESIEPLAVEPDEDEDDLVPAPGCGHPMPPGVDCRVSSRTQVEPVEVPVCLAASRHGGICGQPAPCDGSRHVEPAPAATERRTVSLEVLTPELRSLAYQEYTGDAAVLLDGATVGIVGRLNGRADAVTDVDTDWVRTTAAEVLFCLMRQAVGRADGARAEPPTPPPDVLAALDGRPNAGNWSEPPARSSHTIAAELRALAAVFDAHPDFPVQSFGLDVGQATDGIGGEQAVCRIGELLGLPVEERVREDGRRSWSIYRYGPLSLGWSYVEDEAVTA